MSNKAKKKVQNKSDKELEKRIEEEQKKLEQLKKSKPEKKKDEKPGAKKQKKGKDGEISDKVKKKDREGIQKKLDYHRFLEEQQRKLDYSAMFSYLGGNVRKPQYEYGGWEDDRVKIAHKKNETITWEEVKQVTDEEKINQITGLNRNFESNERREGYKWWKAFNKGLGELLYDTSMT